LIWCSLFYYRIH